MSENNVDNLEIGEQYNLRQIQDDNPRRVTAAGITNRRVVKFTTKTEGDEISVTLTIEGNFEAFAARYGNWQFGLEPPSEITVAILPLGTAVSTEQPAATPAVAPAPALTPAVAIASVPEPAPEVEEPAPEPATEEPQPDETDVDETFAPVEETPKAKKSSKKETKKNKKADMDDILDAIDNAKK